MSAASAQKAPHTLEVLIEKAASRSQIPGAYAGEVTAQEAWDYLSAEASALVDVRTQAEWQFTGNPDLSGTPSQMLKIALKTYPGFAQNPQFSEQVKADVRPDTPVFFLCRSGGRSLDAAVKMTAEGFSHCFNVMGGFEGEPDAEGHRGTVDGWKAAKLPWRQG